MSMVTFGSVVVPLLLIEVFTVMGMLKVSVQVFHLMPRMAPPSFCAIEPSGPPEQAMTLRMNHPLFMISALVPVVGQFSSISWAIGKWIFNSDVWTRTQQQ